MSTGQETEESGSRWGESAFEQLYLGNYSRIVAVLFRLVGERAKAEELAHEVFLKAYRHPLLRKKDGSLAGWLYRTATNLGIDALRAQARRVRNEQAAEACRLETAAAADPLNEVLREEQRCQVRTVLAALKPSHAQILILRASGLSYNELAESLGVSRGSVGTMLARAEAEFHKRFLKAFRKEKQ